MLVTDALGCSDSVSKPLIVHPNPVISLGNDTSICEGQPLDVIASPAGYEDYSFSGTGGVLQTGLSNVYSLSLIHI